MDYDRNRNMETPFFTEGVGTRPETANDFMPENNLDLSSNRTWDSRANTTDISGVELSAESMPEFSDVSVPVNLPPMSASELQQWPSPSAVPEYHFSMSGDRISRSTVSVLSGIVDTFRRGDEEVAHFYDEIRGDHGANESFIRNTFGVKK